MRLKLGCFFLCVTLCLMGFAAEFVHYGQRVPSAAGGSVPPLARGKPQNFSEKQDRFHRKNRRRPSGFFQLTWIQRGEKPSDEIKKQRLLRRTNQSGRALPFAIEMFFPDFEEDFSLRERWVDTTHDLEEKALDPKVEVAGQANDWEEAEEEFFGFYPGDEEEGTGDKDEEPLFFPVPVTIPAPAVQAGPHQNDSSYEEDGEVFGFV
jgi:hypothetical protein